MIKKALQAVAVGLPVVAATLLLSAPNASADIAECEQIDRFCAWAEDNFTGPWAYWPQGTNAPVWGNFGMHDDADSVYNSAAISSDVADNVQVYKNTYYDNPEICVNPGESYDAGMNDNDYDSHEWVHSC